jgi:DNA-binding GntR family transcriptional regulator
VTWAAAAGLDRSMTLDEHAISDILTAALLAGRLSPGLRLGEHQLAALFGVTRERIRKVLHRLGAQRLIDLQPNRGAFVAEPGLREAREVYQARRILEVGVVSHLAGAATETQLRALDAHVEREQRAYDAKDHAESVRLSGLFHTDLAEMTGNPFVIRTLQELVSRTAMLVAYHEARGSECGCAEHRSILRAIGARDGAEAGREMRQHLSLVETRLQAPPVRSSTADLDAVLTEEIRRYTVARTAAPIPPPHPKALRRAPAS